MQVVAFTMRRPNAQLAQGLRFFLPPFALPVASFSAACRARTLTISAGSSRCSSASRSATASLSIGLPDGVVAVTRVVRRVIEADAGSEIKFDDQDLVILREDEVLAVIE